VSVSVSNCVSSRNLNNEAAYVRDGLLRHRKKESALRFSTFAVTQYRRLYTRVNLQNIGRGKVQFGLQNHDVQCVRKVAVHLGYGRVRFKPV
jgi:hypothetical protein